MRTALRAVTGACCCLVATCAISGNGISIGASYTDPQTGAVIELVTDK